MCGGSDGQLAAEDEVLGPRSTGVDCAPAVEPIDDRSIDLTLRQPVLSRASEQTIGADTGVQIVRTRTPDHEIGTILGVTEVQDVIAATTEQPIVAVFTGDEVAPRATIHPVVTGPTIDDVRSTIPADAIATAEPDDDVGANDPGPFLACDAARRTCERLHPDRPFLMPTN